MSLSIKTKKNSKSSRFYSLRSKKRNNSLKLNTKPNYKISPEKINKLIQNINSKFGIKVSF
jgi:hypothetical protein